MSIPVVIKGHKMTSKVFGIIFGTVFAGLIVCWISSVSHSTVQNKVAIAETRQELRSEMKGIANTLNIHYGLLKEIRDDQKKRNGGS